MIVVSEKDESTDRNLRVFKSGSGDDAEEHEIDIEVGNKRQAFGRAVCYQIWSAGWVITSAHDGLLLV
jgi:hypothetical protein